MVKTYNEFKVIYNNGKVIDKKLSDRGTVRINEQTANINNQYVKSTGLLYELGDQPEAKKKPGRKPNVE